MGSAFSRTSSYGGTIIMPLSAQVHFAGSQLEFAEAVKSQQNTLAQVNTATSVQNLQFSVNRNSPDEAALRNFTQTLLKAYSYMGIPALLVGGILFGVNYAFNFMSQAATFAVVLISLLSFYYFVISISQTMKANIATLKIFFLGLFICGIIAGILSFAVYTPPLGSDFKLSKLGETLSIENNATSPACYRISVKEDFGRTVKNVTQIIESNRRLNLKDRPCIVRKDIQNPLLERIFVLPVLDECNACEQYDTFNPKGVFSLNEGKYKEGYLDLLQPEFREIYKHPENNEDFKIVFYGDNIEKLIHDAQEVTKRLLAKRIFKVLPELNVYFIGELDETETEHLSSIFKDVQSGNEDEEAAKYLLKHHKIYNSLRNFAGLGGALTHILPFYI